MICTSYPHLIRRWRATVRRVSEANLQLTKVKPEEAEHRPSVVTDGAKDLKGKASLRFPSWGGEWIGANAPPASILLFAPPLYFIRNISPNDYQYTSMTIININNVQKE